MKGIRRVPLLAFAPILALLALLAWVFASPIGAGPDDDYHLISTWCASSTAAETCAPVAEGSGEHRIPAQLAGISCFRMEATQSAACQDPLFADEMLDRFVVTDRGNFYGEYPPLYYAVMGLFAGDDLVASALAMRVFTVLLFVALLTTLYLVLPVGRRHALILGWLVTTVPLGVFLLASNNPSTWAAIGVGTSWVALLGYFETTGWRRVTLGALYALAVLMAAGSRGDAAMYVGFATALVLVFTFRPRRAYFLTAILPVVMGLVALGFLLLSRQIGSGLSGFTETAPDAGGTGSVEGESLSPMARLGYNLLNAPFLWTGSFGEWGLGWLDTGMPSVVTFGAIGAFLAAGFVGLRRISPRKLLLVALTVLVLWALPVYVLQQGGQIVGDELQPRYLYPLIVLLGGLLALGTPIVEWTRGQLIIIVTALSVANFAALFANLRRYITGVGNGGLNLNAGVEWWWDVPFSPMFVWLAGSLAYAALVFLIAFRMPREPVPEVLRVD